MPTIEVASTVGDLIGALSMFPREKVVVLAVRGDSLPGGTDEDSSAVHTWSIWRVSGKQGAFGEVELLAS